MFANKRNRWKLSQEALARYMQRHHSAGMQSLAHRVQRSYGVEPSDQRSWMQHQSGGPHSLDQKVHTQSCVSQLVRPNVNHASIMKPVWTWMSCFINFDLKRAVRYSDYIWLYFYFSN